VKVHDGENIKLRRKEEKLTHQPEQNQLISAKFAAYKKWYKRIFPTR